MKKKEFSDLLIFRPSNKSLTAYEEAERKAKKEAEKDMFLPSAVTMNPKQEPFQQDRRRKRKRVMTGKRNGEIFCARKFYQHINMENGNRRLREDCRWIPKLAMFACREWRSQAG